MGIIQELYDNGRINEQELEYVSLIKEGMVNAIKDGPIAVSEFVHDTFKDCHNNELEEIKKMAEAIEYDCFYKIANESSPEAFIYSSIAIDNEFVKEAGFKKRQAKINLRLSKAKRTAEELKNLVGYGNPFSSITSSPTVRKAIKAGIIGTMGLALANSVLQGLHLIGRPIQVANERINEKRIGQATLASILKDNPELRKDKKTFDNFYMLQRYAPKTVATNKPVATAMIKMMKEWDYVDPNALKQMIEMEGKHINNKQLTAMAPEPGRNTLPLSPDMIAGASGLNPPIYST